MMDIRELFPDLEEVYRTFLDGAKKHIINVLPASVAKDSKEGHVSEHQIALKGKVVQKDGSIKYVDIAPIQDAPILFSGGGQMVTTHPIKKGDEGILLFSSRPIDSWHQNGGTQNPINTRMHSLSDAFHIPGVRSDPNKIKNYAKDSHQVRSKDAKVTTDHHPTNGKTTKIVDKNDNTEDPFNKAKKFVQSIHTPAGLVSHDAVNGGTKHSVANSHDAGPLLSALNGAHTVNAHPSNGVGIASTVAHTITAPNATLDKAGNLKTAQSINAPTGSFGSLFAGASSGGGGSSGNEITGILDGDVTGPEKSNKVVGITHVANANTLPVCTSDSDAAAQSVAIGGLYVNNTISASFHVLCVRWT